MSFKSKNDTWELKSKEFVDKLYQNQTRFVDVTNKKPITTLTFAQSLDGKISGFKGKPLTISSEASLFMTHRLRYVNDGIMVGIGTVLADNPRLTVRLVQEADINEKQPRPVILDSKLRLPLTCNLLKNQVKPWILTLLITDEIVLEKKKKLEEVGVKIFECPVLNGLINIDYGLEELYSSGIKTLMIEGGSKVIGYFLTSSQERRVIDHLVVTISPTLIGDSGTSSFSSLKNDQETLPHHVPVVLCKDTDSVTYEQFGPDIVMALQHFTLKNLHSSSLIRKHQIQRGGSIHPNL